MGDDCARIYSAKIVAQYISRKRAVFNRAPVGTVFALLLPETDFSTGNNIKSFIEDTMVCDMPQRGGFPSGARLSSFSEYSSKSLHSGLPAFDLSCSLPA